MKEDILVMPDFMLSKEQMIRLDEGQRFHDFIRMYGNGWPDVNGLLRMVDRDRAEQIPNPDGERIRQVVSHVMVFELPDELYERISTEEISRYTDDEWYHFVKNVKSECLSKTKLLAAKRLSGGSESRLFNKLSTAFGGHVDKEDALEFHDGPFLDSIVQTAGQRELNEELKTETTSRFAAYTTRGLIPFGVINSGHNDVSSLHTAFVQVLAVPQSLGMAIRETEKLAMEKVSMSYFLPSFRESVEEFYELETWSKLSMFDEESLVTDYTKAIIRSAQNNQDDSV